MVMDRPHDNQSLPNATKTISMIKNRYSVIRSKPVGKDINKPSTSSTSIGQIPTLKAMSVATTAFNIVSNYITRTMAEAVMNGFKKWSSYTHYERRQRKVITVNICIMCLYESHMLNITTSTCILLPFLISLVGDYANILNQESPKITIM